MVTGVTEDILDIRDILDVLDARDIPVVQNTTDVRDVHAVRDVLDVQGVPVNPDILDTQRSALTETLVGAMGDQSLGGRLAAVTRTLPEIPVSVGDRWDRSDDLALPLGMTIELAYDCTLDAVQGTLATVRCIVNGSLGIDSATMVDEMSAILPGLDLGAAGAEGEVAELVAAAMNLDRFSGTENLVFDLDAGVVLATRSEMTTVLVVQGAQVVTVSKTSVKNQLVH